MFAKFVILAAIAFALAVSVESGVVPAALSLPYAVAPYASSYNAHYVNHAVAAPLVAHAAPLVAHAHAAPLLAHAHAAPLVAAAPAPLFAHSAYTAAAYPAAPAFIAG